MKALVKNNLVVNLSNTEYPEFGGMEWVNCPDDCQPGWTFIDGVFAPPVIPEPIYTKEQLLSRFNASVQSYIDSVAIQKGYSSGLACATYVSSSITMWSLESKAFVDWRDQVWSLTFQAIQPFENDLGELPNIDDFIASLPEIAWPS